MFKGKFAMSKHIIITIFIFSLSFSGLTGCSDDKADTTKSSVSSQPTISNQDDSYDEYTSIHPIELDYLLLKNHPEITQDYQDEFNFRWLRAYDCENSKKIENDMSLFQVIQSKLIADALDEARSTTNKFKVWGAMTLYVTEDDRNVWKLKRIAYKRSFTGSRYKKDAECRDTKRLNTGHSLRLKKIAKNKTIRLSDDVIDKLDISRSSRATIYIVVKFTLDESNFEYYEDKKYFKVKHTGEFDEVTFYASKLDMNKKKHFLILSADELYY